ncbi:MAG: hypothetical protein RIF39_17140, partial [Cyclobacteriaceae bacterium]
SSEIIMRVKYEDLVSNEATVLEGIYKFLNISPEINNKSSFSVPEYTIRQHSSVGRPPNENRIKAWVKCLSARDIEKFEFIAKDFLPCLGYANISTGPCVPFKATEKCHRILMEASRIALNKVKHSARVLQLASKKRA